MQYEPIEPGLFRLHTPAGALSIPTTEDELQAAGHVPLTAPGSPALAQNDGSAGAGNLPASRLDAGGGLGGPGSGAGGAPAQNLDQDIFEGAPNAPEMAPAAEQLANPTRQTRPLTVGAPEPSKGPASTGGTKKIRVSVPTAGAGSGGGKGQDVRVGFKVEKSGVNPADIEAAELANADASIDRKLSAQNIAERKATASEAQSAALGRQIRQEENDLIAQRARDEAMRADFADRQAAIDKERAETDKLAVNPREYVESMPGWARVLSAISILGGSLAGGGRNPGMDALNQEIERSIDAQKSNIQLRKQGLAARENELERLTKLYGDPRAAEAELRDRKRALIQSYAVKQALDAGATDAADNLRAQFADWDQQRAKDRLGLQTALAGTVEEQWKHVYPGAGGAKPKHLSAGQEKVAGLIGTINKLQGDIAGIDDKTSTNLPGEGHIGQRAAKAALDFLGGEGTYASTRSDEENETTRRLQTAKVMAKGILSQATEQGVVTGPEQAPYETAIDSAHDAGSVKKAVDQVLGLMRAKAGAMGAPDVTPEQDFEVQR